MSFEDFETADGKPVELLTFVSGSIAIRYTNVGRPITIGANTWSPLAYSSTEPSLSKDSDDSQITIRVPKTATILGLYNGNYRSNLTSVTVERFHENDATRDLQVFFKGFVGSVNRENGEGVILVIPFQAGDFRIPRYNFGALCSSFLYDTPGCSVLRDNFRYQTVISTITNGTEIAFSGLRDQAAILDAAVNSDLTSDELDNYWLAGYLATAGGELREIMQTNIGADPNVVRILQPFRDAVNGDQCTVYAGCLMNIDICNRKFDNAINFRGWPYVPEIDPAHTELPPGSRTSSSRFSGVQS